MLVLLSVPNLLLDNGIDNKLFQIINSLISLCVESPRNICQVIYNIMYKTWSIFKLGHDVLFINFKFKKTKR